MHYKKFSVPVSTGLYKIDKLLNIPSDSLSEGVIFQNFLGSMPSDPLVLFAHCECKYAN